MGEELEAPIPSFQHSCPNPLAIRISTTAVHQDKQVYGQVGWDAW